MKALKQQRNRVEIMNNAEHFAKIRKLLDEAKATKNRQQVMVWTREIRVLAARFIRTN